MMLRRHVRLPIVIGVLCLLGSTVTTAAASSWERIEFWRTQYQELSSTDPRAAAAQTIFAKLVQVAGKRPGVVPRLFITARDPWEVPLPMAIRDGWILLSPRVLEICAQDQVWGQDRLAFVLGHELAHHLKDDLWHVRLFDAWEAERLQHVVPQEFLDELRRSTEATEHVLAREVQADQQGILYAALAGFSPQAIVSADARVNFFAEWVRALDPRQRLPRTGTPLRPTPEERAEALRTVLRQIADQTAAFQAGLWFYYAGNYLQASQAFDTFRAVFASPEVHLNLAVSHHQQALQAYQVWQPMAPPLPYHLPVALDPLTRASRIALERTRGQPRGQPTDPAVQFRQHLEAAIHWYREALSQDPTYTLAARNLGAALLLRGTQTPKPAPHPDYAEATMLLARAREYAPQDPALLTTLGVALVYDERRDRAQTIFEEAVTRDPTYAAPVFNLGVLARATHREADAQRYQQSAARLLARSTPDQSPVPQPVEAVAGMRPGTPEQEIPAAWGIAARSIVQIGEQSITVATYPLGIMTLAQQGEILMLLVREGYQGSSARGIALGNRADDVLARYGPPTRRHELSQGQIWAYEAPRIAFQVYNGQVVSWLRF